jgi:hypothetical protein
MCVSPNSESFQPPNENAPMGTGIGTLITTRWPEPSESQISLGFPTH